MKAKMSLILFAFAFLVTNLLAEEPNFHLMKDSNCTPYPTNFNGKELVLFNSVTLWETESIELMSPINSSFENNPAFSDNKLSIINSSEVVPLSLVVIDSDLIVKNYNASTYKALSAQEPALNFEETLIWGGLGAIVGAIAYKDSRIAGAAIGFAGGVLTGVILTRNSQSY